MSARARSRIEHELFMRSFMAVNPTSRVMSQLTSVMHDEYYKAGEVIYERGQSAERLFFVVSGKVELTGNAGDVWLLENESVVGILDASRQSTYSRTATAKAPTHAIALNFADYLDVLEDNFDYARNLLMYGGMNINRRSLELGNNHLFEGMHVPIGVELEGLDARKLHTIDRLFVLRSTPMFERAPVQAFASLAQLATQQDFKDGERIFSIDEVIKELHVLVAGRVRLRRSKEGIDALIAPTRVLGGLVAFGYGHRYYEAVAEGNAIALVIQKEDLFDVMEDHFGLVRSLFAQISEEHERLMRVTQGRRASEPPPAGKTMSRASLDDTTSSSMS